MGKMGKFIWLDLFCRDDAGPIYGRQMKCFMDRNEVGHWWAWDWGWMEGAFKNGEKCVCFGEGLSWDAWRA
jgi:hypothetical protein